MAAFTIRPGRCWLALLLAWPALLPASEPEPEPDLLALPLEDLARLQVDVATGTPKPLPSTPAATTVLLRPDFRAMGAQTVDEALASVPGLHVAPHSGVTGDTRYFMRGIASTTNAQALVLVNGIPVNTMLLDNSNPPLVGGLPLKMIQRIEVIRGPGSAVYGADAFAGVINIITRDAEALSGSQAGASYGSFDSLSSYVSHGGRLGGARAGLFLGYSSTDGANGSIPADAQTANDLATGTRASLAPGRLSQGQQRFDAYSSLQWKHVDTHVYWREVRDYGTNQGLGNALDPWGRFSLQRLGTDATWHDEGLGRWDLSTLASYMHTEIRTTTPLHTLPPGAFGFPEGLIDDFSLLEDDARLQFTALYHGWERHRLRLGTGLSLNDLYKTEERNNYFYPAAGAPPSPQPGGLVDVSDTAAVFVPERQRTGSFVFAQDEWQLNERWELTSGLRFDHYSDFGDVTTPRLALVWQTTPVLTSKLLYGEAFRAPSFSELYVTSNPFALGNANLRPERLRSLELAFDYRPNEQWAWTLNLYRQWIRDFIDFVPPSSGNVFVAANIGRYHGRGLEAQVSYQQGGLQLLANLSLQHIESLDAGAALGVAPRHEAYLRASQQLGPGWQLSAQLDQVGPRDRQPGDPQQALAGYSSLDVILRHQLRPGLEVYAQARNVLDDDVTEPGITPLPAYLPGAGRNFLIGVNVSW